MKYFDLGRDHIYISNECLKEVRIVPSLKKLTEIEQARFCADSSYIRLGVGGYHAEKDHFLEFCSELTGKTDELSVGILSAHGDNFFRKWCYSDGLFPPPVQKWLDANDGLYDLLLLDVCNSAHAMPNIRKSLTVVPQGIISIMGRAYIDNKLIIPGKGEITVNSGIVEKLPDYNLLQDLIAY
jgi:hypothetical protein